MRFLVIKKFNLKYLQIFKIYKETKSIIETLGDSAVLVIIFWNFTIIQYRPDSPQAKKRLDIQYCKLGIQVPSRVSDLGNQEILEKSQTWVDRQPSEQKLNGSLGSFCIFFRHSFLLTDVTCCIKPFSHFSFSSVKFLLFAT